MFAEIKNLMNWFNNRRDTVTEEIDELECRLEETAQSVVNEMTAGTEMRRREGHQEAEFAFHRSLRGTETRGVRGQGRRGQSRRGQGRRGEDRVGEDRVGERDISLQVTKLQKSLDPDTWAINHPPAQRARKQTENPGTRQELSSHKGMQSDGNKVSISNTSCLSSHCLLAELLQSHLVRKGTFLVVKEIPILE